MSRKRIKKRREQEQKRRRLYWILGIAGIAIIVAAIVILPLLQNPDEVVAPASFDWPEAEGIGIGDPEAPVVIVEYSDFQCPFCRQFHEQTLPSIIDNHVRTGEVYFEYRHFSFIGRESLEAANASLCAAEQGQFWPYSAYLFANQTGENVGAYSEARLQAMALELGLDMDAFEQCSSRNERADDVQADYAQGLDIGVNSTPTFYVNGKEIRGALPYAQFRAEIEAALQAAQ